nr:immunoglobulin heavy chain junction region [Macaca mulatta]
CAREGRYGGTDDPRYFEFW